VLTKVNIEARLQQGFTTSVTTRLQRCLKREQYARDFKNCC